MAKTPTEVASLARAHTATAIKVLHGVMTRSDAADSARVAAAQALLDRGWGKPVQGHEGPAPDGAFIFRWLKEGE